MINNKLNAELQLRLNCVLFAHTQLLNKPQLKKGEKRVRAFGGVPVFPLIKLHVRGPLRMAIAWCVSCDFCSILAVLSACRRHHKPPLRGGRQHAAAQHAKAYAAAATQNVGKQQIMRRQLEAQVVSLLTPPKRPQNARQQHSRVAD